jgi:hypothetical protein
LIVSLDDHFLSVATSSRIVTVRQWSEVSWEGFDLTRRLECQWDGRRLWVVRSPIAIVWWVGVCFGYGTFKKKFFVKDGEIRSETRVLRTGWRKKFESIRINLSDLDPHTEGCVRVPGYSQTWNPDTGLVLVSVSSFFFSWKIDIHEWVYFHEKVAIHEWVYVDMISTLEVHLKKRQKVSGCNLVNDVEKIWNVDARSQVVSLCLSLMCLTWKYNASHT